MKGPVVAALLYPDAGDRSYAELDLLVGRSDLPRAMAIPEDLGYRLNQHPTYKSAIHFTTPMSTRLGTDPHWGTRAWRTQLPSKESWIPNSLATVVI